MTDVSIRASSIESGLSRSSSMSKAPPDSRYLLRIVSIIDWWFASSTDTVTSNLYSISVTFPKGYSDAMAYASRNRLITNRLADRQLVHPWRRRHTGRTRLCTRIARSVCVKLAGFPPSCVPSAPVFRGPSSIQSRSPTGLRQNTIKPKSSRPPMWTPLQPGREARAGRTCAPGTYGTAWCKL